MRAVVQIEGIERNVRPADAAHPVAAERRLDLDPADDVDRVLAHGVCERSVHQRVGQARAWTDRDLDDGEFASAIEVAARKLAVPFDLDGNSAQVRLARRGVGRSQQQGAAQGVRRRGRDLQLNGRVLAHPPGTDGDPDLLAPPDGDLPWAEPAVAATRCGVRVIGQFGRGVRRRQTRKVEVDLHDALRVSLLVSHRLGGCPHPSVARSQPASPGTGPAAAARGCPGDRRACRGRAPRPGAGSA